MGSRFFFQKPRNFAEIRGKEGFHTSVKLDLCKLKNRK